MEPASPSPAKALAPRLLNVPAPVTELNVVLIVILSLALLSVLGFVGTFILVRDKVDGSAIAVFSGLTGTVVGGLMSALNNTRTAPKSTANDPVDSPEAAPSLSVTNPVPPIVP